MMLILDNSYAINLEYVQSIIEEDNILCVQFVNKESWLYLPIRYKEKVIEELKTYWGIKCQN